MRWIGHQGVTMSQQLACAREMLRLATLKEKAGEWGMDDVVRYWDEECRILAICIIGDGCAA